MLERFFLWHKPLEQDGSKTFTVRSFMVPWLDILGVGMSELWSIDKLGEGFACQLKQKPQDEDEEEEEEHHIV